MTDRKLMQAALDELITCEVQIEGEWGLGRSMEQIDADGDTSPVILALRERLAQPEQEPVQYKCTVIDDVHPNGIPLEQWSKPQRTWVDLTDEEIQAVAKQARSKDHAVTLTGRLLKEKNT